MSCFLALDTATDRGSIAVGRPRAILAEVFVGARRHAAALTPSIEEALHLAGTSLDDVTGILVADGPGSFTGLRIALATAQGIVRQRPHLAVMTAPSLMSAALVASRFAHGPVAALFDALRGEVFAAVYQFNGIKATTVLSPTLTPIAALREAGIRAEVAVGDGAAAFASEVEAWTGRPPVPPPDGGPRAASLIELSAAPENLRMIENISEFEPNYGRLAEAQVRWEKQHGKPLPGTVGDPR
jgi:tRNA threonylcarbamoyladenosine biosynthesis protein TsaB